MGLKKLHVCRECGNRFRHPRHLWDHRLDTGHGLPKLKATAKAMARVAKQSPVLAETMQVSRSTMMRLMRRLGKKRARRWARKE